MTKNKSLGDKIYEGAGTFGHIEAWIGAIFSSVIGLVFIIIGIVSVSHKTSLTNKVKGTITTAICSPYQSDNQQFYNCSLTIEYTVDNKTYPIEATTNDNFQHVKNETIDVYYNPSKPEKGAIKSDNTKTMGIIFIVVGIIVPAFAWLWLWITYKSKFAAAAGGMAGAFNLIKN